VTKRTREPQLDVFTYNDFVGRFHDETDRAAAVLAGGYLDAFLGDAIRSVLVPGDRVESLFDGQGPLRSLGNKIALACALGLATDALARDMDLIRRIRNHFAHHIWDATFDMSPVCDWCSQIEVVDSSVDETTKRPIADTNPPRLRYLLAVACTTMLIAHSLRVPDAFRERMTGIRRHA
jgi:Mannitol repressor